MPPGETGLYLTIKTGQVVDGEIPGCIENVIRPSMEADHPKWRAYVEQKAKRCLRESGESVKWHLRMFQCLQMIRSCWK